MQFRVWTTQVEQTGERIYVLSKPISGKAIFKVDWWKLQAIKNKPCKKYYNSRYRSRKLYKWYNKNYNKYS